MLVSVIILCLGFLFDVAAKDISDRVARLVEDKVLNVQKNAMLKKNAALKRETLRPKPLKVKRKLDSYAEQKRKAQKLRNESKSLKKDLRRVG